MSIKLQRRSDDAVETKDGLFAVKMRVKSGVNGDKAWFDFKTNQLAQTIRVEWPADGYAIIPQTEAQYLLRERYALGLTDEELDSFNKAVEVAEKSEEKRIADLAAKEAADKAAADKAAADAKAAEEAKAAAAAKEAADKKAAADKAAADKAAADAKAAADKEAADKAAANKAK